MIALIPILAAFTGLVLYCVATNAKMVEAGRILYACGALVSLAVLAGHTVRLLP